MKKINDDIMKIFTLLKNMHNSFLLCLGLIFTFLGEGGTLMAVDKYITIKYNVRSDAKFYGFVDSMYQEIEAQNHSTHTTPKFVSKKHNVLDHWEVDSVSGTVVKEQSQSQVPLQKGNTVAPGTVFSFQYDDEENNTPKDSLYISFTARFRDVGDVSGGSGLPTVKILPFQDLGTKGLYILDVDTPYVYFKGVMTANIVNIPYGGWDFPNFSNMSVPEGSEITKDTLVYVSYTAHTCTIEFKICTDAEKNQINPSIKWEGRNTDMSSLQSVSYSFGERIITPVLTSTDYVFEKWTPTFNGLLPIILNKNERSFTYTAKWIHKDSLWYKNKGGDFQEYTVYYYQCDTTGNHETAILIDSLHSIAKRGKIQIPYMEYKGFVTPEKSIVTLGTADSVWHVYYTKEQYTIQWDANGGSFANNTKIINDKYTNGKLLKLPTPPTREDYTFVKWITKKIPNIQSISYELDTTQPYYVEAYQTYVAQWEKNPKVKCAYSVTHRFPNLDGTDFKIVIITDSVLEDSILTYPVCSDSIPGFELVGELKKDTIKKNQSHSCTYTYKRSYFQLQWGNVPNDDNMKDVSFIIIPGNYSVAGWYKYGEPIIAPNPKIDMSFPGYTLIGWEEQNNSVEKFHSSMPAKSVIYVPRWDVGTQSDALVVYTINYMFQTPYGDYELRYSRTAASKNENVVQEIPLHFKYYSTPSDIEHTIKKGENNDITFVYNYEGTHNLKWIYNNHDFTIDQSKTPRGKYTTNGQYNTGTYLVPPCLKEIASYHFNGWKDSITGEPFNGVMPNRDVTYIADTINVNDNTKVAYKIRMEFQQMRNDRMAIVGQYAQVNDNNKIEPDMQQAYFRDTIFYANPHDIIEVEAREIPGFEIQDDGSTGYPLSEYKRKLKKVIEDTTTVFTFRYKRKRYNLTWNFNQPSDIDDEINFQRILPADSTYKHGELIYGQRIISPAIKKDPLLGYDFDHWINEQTNKNGCDTTLVQPYNTSYKAIWKGNPKVDTSKYERYCAKSIAYFPLKYMDYIREIKIEFQNPTINEMFKNENAYLIENFNSPTILNDKKYASFVIPTNCTYGSYKFFVSFNDLQNNLVKVDTGIVHVNFNPDGLVQVNEYALVVNDNLWKNMFDITQYDRRYIWQINGTDTIIDSRYGSNFYVSTSPLNGDYGCICYVFPKNNSGKIVQKLEFCPKTISSTIQSNKTRLRVSPRIVTDQINIKIDNPQLNLHNLHIFSVLGQTIYSTTFTENETNLDLSFLPTGEYLIKVDDESLVFIKE